MEFITWFICSASYTLIVHFDSKSSASFRSFCASQLSSSCEDVSLAILRSFCADLVTSTPRSCPVSLFISFPIFSIWFLIAPTYASSVFGISQLHLISEFVTFISSVIFAWVLHFTLLGRIADCVAVTSSGVDIYIFAWLYIPLKGFDITSQVFHTILGVASTILSTYGLAVLMIGWATFLTPFPTVDAPFEISFCHSVLQRAVIPILPSACRFSAALGLACANSP